jgi:hypothetical protein
MDARNTLLSLAFLACLGAAAGCAHSQAPAVAPATQDAHPMLGFAVAGSAPRPADTAQEPRPERPEEPGHIVDAMHGWSRGSPR